MPMNQRREMAKFAIEKIDHRVKLIIGTSHMVADEIISFSNFCLDAGADAVMILPPYYFHFGPSALLQYYDRLAEQIHGDIYIYNFPDNTGYTIPPETVLALAKMHPNIVGMKDTVPGMDHTRELIKVVKSQIPQFEIYSGFDDNFAHNVLSGRQRLHRRPQQRGAGDLRRLGPRLPGERPGRHRQRPADHRPSDGPVCHPQPLPARHQGGLPPAGHRRHQCGHLPHAQRHGGR